MNENKNDIGLKPILNKVTPNFITRNQISVNTYLGTLKKNLP